MRYKADEINVNYKSLLISRFIATLIDKQYLKKEIAGSIGNNFHIEEKKKG